VFVFGVMIIFDHQSDANWKQKLL